MISLSFFHPLGERNGFFWTFPPPVGPRLPFLPPFSLPPLRGVGYLRDRGSVNPFH